MTNMLLRDSVRSSWDGVLCIAAMLGDHLQQSLADFSETDRFAAASLHLVIVAPFGPLHVDGLDVHELADAESAALAAITGILHAAEWGTRIGADILIHEAHPRFEFVRRDAATPLYIRREHAGSEAELAIVRNANCVCFIVGRDNRRNRPEDLLVMRRLAGPYIRQHRRRIPRT